MTTYIKEIVIKNFKSFKDEKVEFRRPSAKYSGLNIFVGENNCGKSSLIEAINFLFEGTKKKLSDLKNKGAGTDDKLSVEITLSGDIDNLINNFCQENKKEVFKKYIFKKDDEDILIAKRDEDDLKSIFFYNSSNNTYKNEAGIDAPFKKLFSMESIQADKSPDDDISYSSASSPIKKLLTLIASDFEDKQEYKDFSEMYERTFNREDSPIRQEINLLQRETEDILQRQFGNIKLKLNFDRFDKEEFFKNSSVKVTDSYLDGEVDFEEKGEGTQRAISLSLIQVYANRLKKHPKDSSKSRPLFLFVDEPEISLHPEAQKRLLESFEEICKTEQVFISTHSPYFISPSLFKQVYRFQNSKEKGTKVSYDRNSELKNMRENRKFFFHHRDILFKDKVLFLEGAEDLERYSRYFEKVGKEKLLPYLYMLGGKEDFGDEIRKFCEVFNIKCLCVQDLDRIKTIIQLQSQLPARTSSENQKAWFRRVYTQINFNDPRLLQAIENDFKTNFILVNPYEDVKLYINDDGSVNPEGFDFSIKLFQFLES